MFATVTLLTLVNSVSGTPYISGGDSPRGTDCSGLVSWVTNAASGRPIYGDRFNTGNIERALLARGFQYGSQPGALNVGWNGGHTAATLPDGTPVSSGEGGGVRIGGGGAFQKQFTHHMFLPMPAPTRPRPRQTRCRGPGAMMPFMPPPTCDGAAAGSGCHRWCCCRAGAPMAPPPAPEPLDGAAAPAARIRSRRRPPPADPFAPPAPADIARASLTRARIGRPFTPSASVSTVIVLLPPSETKRVGGDGPPLRLEALSSPELGPLRDALVDELVELAGDQSACRRALGISASQDAEIERNAALRSAATLPAISRYTGVLYDALDIGSLRGASAARARSPACGRLRAVRAAACRRSGARLPALRDVEAARTTHAWLRDGGRCSNRCWRRSRRVNWSSICDPVPTRRSEGCPARSRSTCWPSMPMAGAPW